MDWYIKCWKESFNFSGRARRKEYWTFVLFNCIIGLLLTILSNLDLVGVQLLYGAYALASIPANWAVTFRRLHDTNHSGWNMIIAGILPFVAVLPFVLVLVFFQPAVPETAMPWFITAIVIFGLLTVVLNLRIFYLMLKPSDIGPNQYGEDPIGDPDRKPGNTLVACFVVVLCFLFFVIVGLVAIVLPAFSKAREKAQDVACCCNLRQIGLVLTMYAVDNDGYLPMELGTAELEQLSVVSCPPGTSNLPYQLLDSAKGLKLSDLENPDEIPLMVCDNHRKTLNVLFADGSVKTMSWDDIPAEMLSRIIPVEELQE